MKRRVRNWRIWALTGMLLTAAVLVPVFAARQQGDLTATPYADVIRFEAGGAVESLQITIFDLSGRELWGSGVVSSRIIDWDRRNEFGERLAYGAYLYQAVGWDVDGSVVLERSGKLALLPGDRVQLQAAPPMASSGGDEEAPSVGERPLTPMALGDHGIFGRVSIGTTASARLLHVHDSTSSGQAAIKFTDEVTGTTSADGFQFNLNSSQKGLLVNYENTLTGINLYGGGDFKIYDSGDSTELLYIRNGGNVGIGTANPVATLQVQGDEANLLALYDSANPIDIKFKVAKTGNVYADGSYYSPTTAVQAGSADIAERINTSEWVEPGNVVEIDPDHPGFFRKANSPYSKKVAGIISTSPGVVLGNNFDAEAEKWEDNRPVLAIAGRVPVKATAENGSIQIGDLLVSSSIPGYAARCDDPPRAVGAVIGKAMEPLEEGTGVIMAQVMLR